MPLPSTAVRRARAGDLLCAALAARRAPAQADTIDARRAARGAARPGARPPAGAPAAAAAARRAPRGLARAAAAARARRDRRAAGRRGCSWASARTPTVPAVAATLRALGAEAEAFGLIGVLAARVPVRRRRVGRAARRPARGLRRARPQAAGGRRPLRHASIPPPGSSSPGSSTTCARARRIAAAGGGSSRTVAVIDTGARREPPRVRRPRSPHLRHRHRAARRDRRDRPRHLRRGPDRGHRRQRHRRQGRGGQHPARGRCAPRATASSRSSDLIRGIDFSIRSGADVLNMSLAGRRLHRRSQARALEAAFFNDVLPGGGLGQQRAGRQPARVPGRGGRRRARRARASACRWPPRSRTAAVAPFSEPQPLRQPGRARAQGRRGCEFGVFSTLPGQHRHDLGRPGALLARLRRAAAPATPTPRARASRPRSPRASPRSSGRWSRGWPPSRWPRCSPARRARPSGAAGTSSPARAWSTAARRRRRSRAVYDVTAPRARGNARRGWATAVRVRVRAVARPHGGAAASWPARDQLRAARLAQRRPELRRVAGAAAGRSRRTVRLRGTPARTCSSATACDRNGNCGIKRLGPLPAVGVARARGSRAGRPGEPLTRTSKCRWGAEAVAGAADVADHLALAHARAVRGGEARLVGVARGQLAVCWMQV